MAYSFAPLLDGRMCHDVVQRQSGGQKGRGKPPIYKSRSTPTIRPGVGEGRRQEGDEAM